MYHHTWHQSGFWFMFYPSGINLTITEVGDKDSGVTVTEKNMFFSKQDCESICSFDLGKSESAKSLVNCSTDVEDNAENIEDGTLICEVSEWSKWVFLWYFELRMCALWSAMTDDSLIVIKETSDHWNCLVYLRLRKLPK